MFQRFLGQSRFRSGMALHPEHIAVAAVVLAVAELDAVRFAGAADFGSGQGRGLVQGVPAGQEGAPAGAIVWSVA
jgi:hypothetical protein